MVRRKKTRDRSIGIVARVAVDRSGTCAVPIETQRTLRVTGKLLSGAALREWPGARSQEDFLERAGEGFHRVTRALAEWMSLARERRRAKLVADLFLRGTADRLRAEAVLRRYLGVAVMARTCASDPTRRASLVALAVANATTAGPGARSEWLEALLVVSVLGDLRDRLFVARAQRQHLSPWVCLIDRLRLKRFLARTGLRRGRPELVYGRFLEDADFLRVAEAFLRLFCRLRKGLLPGSHETSALVAESATLETILGHGSAPPLAETRQPSESGFTPGNLLASLPPPHKELSAWYWSRAPVLPVPPRQTVTRINRTERDVAELKRCESRESRSLALPLAARPLRHRPVREDDDPCDIDFSHLCVADELAVSDGMSFGVGAAFPAAAVPYELRRAHVREGVRRETVLVRTEIELGQLGGDAASVERILFIRDSSGSMGGFVEGTKLDGVTLGIYSVLKTLLAFGKHKRFEYGAVDFSNCTHFSGFVRWSALDALEDVALLQQNGGTTLDLGVISRALEAGRETLVLLLTDGALQVRGGTEAELLQLLQKHVTYVIAAEQAVASFCGKAAAAGITTLLLDRFEHVVPVFSAVVAGASGLGETGRSSS
ncbi:MAG TPA: hypothetical protein VGK73_20920 [Polyangiaceae bacterium]